jgi:hypothetical protein
MSKCVFVEVKVAEALGVPREDVVGLRKAGLLGSEWSMDSGEMRLSRKGVGKILKERGLRVSKETFAEVLERSTCEKKEAEPAGDGRLADATMVVIPETLQIRNRIMLWATPKEAAAVPASLDYRDRQGRVRVRVQDNRNFGPGMEMVCRHVDRDLWEYTGSLPRGFRSWY